MNQWRDQWLNLPRGPPLGYRYPPRLGRGRGLGAIGEWLGARGGNWGLFEVRPRRAAERAAERAAAFLTNLCVLLHQCLVRKFPGLARQVAAHELALEVGSRLEESRGALLKLRLEVGFSSVAGRAQATLLSKLREKGNRGARGEVTG